MYKEMLVILDNRVVGKKIIIGRNVGLRQRRCTKSKYSHGEEPLGKYIE
jgi:hypothetical protein